LPCLGSTQELVYPRHGADPLMMRWGWDRVGISFPACCLTPFYFLNAGMKVYLPALWAGLGLVVILLAVKIAMKVIGVWPLARAFGLGVRESNYTTLLMSTGLTFGTISALFGLNKGYINNYQYSVLVTVVIASAVVPTVIAQTFFRPRVEPAVEFTTAPPATPTCPVK